MTEKKGSIFISWVIITLLILYFLLYSLFSYLVVGDRGHPGWDFGTVRDVPAGSAYAIYKKLPYPQHVKGQMGK
ncbi:MAG: hypothetical protein JRH18_09105 [Deltaproteobacteria bacterium]|nr:hypothetical protein [Deltaproteobacteria bacterium]MBW1962991.1 hypothetical protein [Deltaproteobacteria bacterium]MBW1993186.1 hypothetical protein [Deltaproteobacteria bacterium]MBW2151812.1 hypothetical protein [Deltaproteobacteria bacterium]